MVPLNSWKNDLQTCCLSFSLAPFPQHPLIPFVEQLSFLYVLVYRLSPPSLLSWLVHFFLQPLGHSQYFRNTCGLGEWI